MGTGLGLALAITGATMLVLACVWLPFLIASWTGRQLLATGIAAQAVIESMADTGVTINGQPLVSFVLGVRTQDGQVHRVTHRQSLPRLPMGMVVPGAVVPVKVDPQRRDRVRIDWASWRPAPHGA
ncbi:DUF3592 domain-containing protein [Nonomuraea angiospora]|uniref:DUF3592 domain-containing protein n=1 Tax=Nonomuraea angiospora TaxID=46172 RepID=A0ABR9LVG6_9ACTN|nr:DUF3592 domain-containing protein [Nonomuraea angiospora]MBE1584647.1 hypothetical protein [Nonomuraea angiospora]